MIGARRIMKSVNKVAAQYEEPLERAVFKLNSIDLLLDVLDVYLNKVTKDELMTVQDFLIEKIHSKDEEK